MSFRLTRPRACRWPPWNASISSPIQRASASLSQCPIRRTGSPGSASVHSVLPNRPWFAAIRPDAAARICGVDR